MSSHMPILSECDNQGINGNCNLSCYIYLGGDCPLHDEMRGYHLEDLAEDVKLMMSRDQYSMEQAIEILQEELEDEELIELLKKELFKQTKKDVEEAWERAKGVL